MQALGGLLGWCAWGLSADFRRQFNRQVAMAQVDPVRARAAIAAAGRMVAELPWVWSRSASVTALSRMDWDGEHHVTEALGSGRGLIIMSPHLGSWEIGAQALAERFGPQFGDWLVLFRPPRKPWLQPLIEQSRQRPHLNGVPTNLTGVRRLVRALKAGGATAILPDQVPSMGLGVWAPMWGQPAYTMTLLPRLVQQTGAVVLLTWCERLPGGRFVTHFRPLKDPAWSDSEASVQQLATAMNREVEDLVREHPEQYLWGYNRYKQPREGD